MRIRRAGINRRPHSPLYSEPLASFLLSITPYTKAHNIILEAGEDLTEDPRVTTPALFTTLLGSDANWNTITEAQVSQRFYITWTEHHLALFEKKSALENRTTNIPYGRVLGGSSAISGQAFVATSKATIDSWGELGNPGWS